MANEFFRRIRRTSIVRKFRTLDRALRTVLTRAADLVGAILLAVIIAALRGTTLSQTFLVESGWWVVALLAGLLFVIFPLRHGIAGFFAVSITTAVLAGILVTWILRIALFIRSNYALEPQGISALTPWLVGAIVLLALLSWRLWRAESSPAHTSNLGAALLGGVVVAAALTLVQFVFQAEFDATAARRDLQLTFTLQRDFRGIVLRGRDLSYFILNGQNFSGADFRNANLSWAQLTRVNLSRANLWGANLTGANLQDCILNEAKLYGTELSDAGLFRSDLSRAEIFGANLSNADLQQANLTDATFAEGAVLDGADLTDADLSGADLSSLDLSNVKLTNVTHDDRTEWPEGFPRP
jgi:uncharacterized protein YjbI with pentapeptide repeats